MSTAQRREIEELRTRANKRAKRVAMRYASLAALLMVACGDDIALPEPDAGKKDAGNPVDSGFEHVIVAKEIEPEVGGTVELDNGPGIEIPAGALPAGSTAKITIETTPAEGPSGTASPVWQFGPEGLVFEMPVPVSVPFDLAGRDPSQYTIFWSRLDGNGYDDLPTTFSEGRAHTAVEHFSTCGVRLTPPKVSCPSETSTARDDNDDGVIDGCDCKSGFEKDDDGKCVDIDECAADNGGCDSEVLCMNTLGGRTCGNCPMGYTGSGDDKCTDINECDTNNGGCDSHAACTNTAGSFTCGSCPEGYTGGGSSVCNDINECESNAAQACDALTTCANTDGSYTCTACPSGYLGTGKAGCVNIDECAGAGCGPHALCTDTAGSYQCACADGYANWTAGNGCADVDECATDNGGCGPNWQCTNSPGGFTCVGCKAGYEMDDSEACVDTDECEGDNDCVAHQVCQDTDGSYECLPQCENGWEYDTDAHVCSDINECLENGSAAVECAAAHKTCMNNDGAAVCGSCLTGYVASAGNCISDPNYNACTSNFGTTACDEVNKNCVDGSGTAYACTGCKAGYVDDGDGVCISNEGYNACADGGGAADCNTEHKNCVDGSGAGYTCTGCKSGYLSGPNSTCVAVKKCIDDDGAGTASCLDDGEVCMNHAEMDWTCVPSECSQQELADCTIQNKACALVITTPTCTSCLDGYEDDGGDCVLIEPATCEDEGTELCDEEQNRTCEEGENGEDYNCGNCLDGYIQDGEDCVVSPSPIGCFNVGKTACDMLHKTCSAQNGAWDCGDCAQGYMDASGVCVPVVVVTCTDVLKNGAETDVDCGGGTCPDCDLGEACLAGTDCTSGVCDALVCAAPAPTCLDGDMNGTETDIDCGGTCPACDAGEDCAIAGDCTSGVCDELVCAAPACGDEVKNGTETDVDCGGTCGGCDIGEDCAIAGDCTSGVCDALVCAAPACNDEVQNGAETGVDCGGSCGLCGGATCDVGLECASGVCTGITCEPN